eukprot:363203-Chlamydomonas_euryale.AAC.43
MHHQARDRAAPLPPPSIPCSRRTAAQRRPACAGRSARAPRIPCLMRRPPAAPAWRRRLPLGTIALNVHFGCTKSEMDLQSGTPCRGAARRGAVARAVAHHVLHTVAWHGAVHCCASCVTRSGARGNTHGARLREVSCTWRTISCTPVAEYSSAAPW